MVVGWGLHDTVRQQERPMFWRIGMTMDTAKWWLALVLLSMVFAGPGQAQVPALAQVHAGDDYQGAIEASREAIREIMEAQGVPGASVAVGIGGEIVWSEGFGWADLEQGVPVTTLTKFRVGSVSKSMTAAGIGLLDQEVSVVLDAHGG